MTAETAPMTAEQITARVAEIAPYPAMGTPHQAEAVARWLIVNALRRWKRTMDFPADDDAAGKRLHMMTMSAMMSDFAAAHLLVRALGSNRGLAEIWGVQIREAWDDGQRVGEWLWEHAGRLGIDPEEPGRLEEASQDLKEDAPAASHSPSDASLRIGYDILSAACSRLASAAQMAPEAHTEIDARCRYASRALEDARRVTGTAEAGRLMPTGCAS